ncbi:MAG: thiamine phosphate synthase [Bowdeniella nasicola]|nr:thiamine phosphate synthase [Bowdeniella nasicola]
MSAMRERGIYLVTDHGLCGARGVVETVRQAVAAGVRIVQLRAKDETLSGHLRELAALSDVITSDTKLLVNDRLDVAVAARSRGLPVAGVHLGQGDVAVSEARTALGTDAIIGLSASTLREVRDAPTAVVDYLGIGPIHATTTKPDHPPALGASGFRARVAATNLPCFAIGGVQTDDIAALVDAGAAGIAVVSAICGASDAYQAAASLQTTWQQEQK